MLSLLNPVTLIRKSIPIIAFSVMNHLLILINSWNQLDLPYHILTILINFPNTGILCAKSSIVDILDEMMNSKSSIRLDFVLGS